jgi:hypothetical protein
VANNNFGTFGMCGAVIFIFISRHFANVGVALMFAQCCYSRLMSQSLRLVCTALRERAHTDPIEDAAPVSLSHYVRRESLCCPRHGSS